MNKINAALVALSIAVTAGTASAEIIILRPPDRAQEADDPPRLGETAAEYKARIARTRGDREALREAQREAQEKAHREALERASKQYEKAVKDFDQTIKDQKARAARAREIRCNRLSQRAALNWSPSATARYEDECG
jgi:flagellar biosynthesis/type III secretory pathway protein FliH